MFKLRERIDNLTTRRVNAEIVVRDNAIFIGNDKKYEYGNWHIKVDNVWNNLQGGVPDYTLNENLDADIFEEVTQDDKINKFDN